MSRRNRIGLSKPNKGKSGIIGKSIKTKRKMKPMLGDKTYNYCKLTYDDSGDVPYSLKTKSLKLELKNANRSVKKRERRMAKELIKNELIEIFNKVNNENN